MTETAQRTVTVDGLELHPVPGKKPLYVTADGRHVYARKNDGTGYEQRTQFVTGKGYLIVLHTQQPKRTIGVHVLVARAFLGEPPSARHIVARKNGNRQDNRPENLYYSTHSAVMRDAFYRRNPHIPRREKKTAPAAEVRLSPWERAMNEYRAWSETIGEVPPFDGPTPRSTDFDNE